MEYITTKEASARWGISTTRITILANEGRIPGAQRLGKSWLIPADASKPSPHKAHQPDSVKEETDHFSFPLYHFRPDWSSSKEALLSTQQKSLLMAETAVLECRFAEAYPLLTSILSDPKDIITEIGCLWNIGICCIALNNPSVFSKVLLRLQVIFSEDFPHREDLQIILDTLKTYVTTIGSIAISDSCSTDVHDQCLPLTCVQIGYMHLTKEAINLGTADSTIMELNLRLLKNTGSFTAFEMMHIYLMGIYYLRQNTQAAETHAKAVVQIAYDHKIYFPFVTYYGYFASVLSPILAQYPEAFQKHCLQLISQYEENFTAFLSASVEYSAIAKLNDADYPYIYAVLMDLPNSLIADELNISQQTVKRKLARIYEKLGVSTKKELRDYLHDYM